MSGIVESIAAAITRMESVDPKYNNPGGIMDLGYYRQTGQFRLMTYGSFNDGYDALRKLVGDYISSGNTLSTFFQKYAPKGHGNNDPIAYAQFVSNETGIPLNANLMDVANGDLSSPGVLVDTSMSESSQPEDMTLGSSTLAETLFIGIVASIAGIILVRGFSG